MTACVMLSCPRPRYMRTWCRAHYKRWLRHGDPAGRYVMQGASLAERIERGLPVDRTPDGCWEWQRSRLANGYGVISLPDGTTGIAHRVIYEHLVGPVDPDLDLDHLCRAKACCNPRHLEPVTRGENNLRMWRARRQAVAA